MLHDPQQTMTGMGRVGVVWEQYDTVSVDHTLDPGSFITNFPFGYFNPWDSHPSLAGYYYKGPAGNQYASAVAAFRGGSAIPRGHLDGIRLFFT